jgi:hypothetical protein
VIPPGADPDAGRRELRFALHVFDIKKSREITDLVPPLDIRGVGEHFELFHYGSFMAGVYGGALWPSAAKSNLSPQP